MNKQKLAKMLKKLNWYATLVLLAIGVFTGNLWFIAIAAAQHFPMTVITNILSKQDKIVPNGTT